MAVDDKFHRALDAIRDAAQPQAQGGTPMSFTYLVKCEQMQRADRVTVEKMIDLLERVEQLTIRFGPVQFVTIETKTR